MKKFAEDAAWFQNKNILEMSFKKMDLNEKNEKTSDNGFGKYDKL